MAKLKEEMRALGGEPIDPLSSRTVDGMAGEARKVLYGSRVKAQGKLIYVPSSLDLNAWQVPLNATDAEMMQKITFIDMRTITDMDRPSDSQTDGTPNATPKRSGTSTTTIWEEEEVSGVEERLDPMIQELRSRMGATTPGTEDGLSQEVDLTGEDGTETGSRKRRSNRESMASRERNAEEVRITYE